MPITGENVSEWAVEMADLAAHFTDSFQGRYGYPPGDNSIIMEPDPSGNNAPLRELIERHFPDDLVSFYGVVREVLLGDLGNGIWISSAEDVVRGRGDYQPAEVAGALEGKIVVFGTDGGGALISMAEDGRVYSLHDGYWPRGATSYDVGSHGVDLLAPNLWEFLESMRAELRRAVESSQ